MRAIALLLIFVLATPVAAQDTETTATVEVPVPPAMPPGDDNIVSMQTGDRAQHAGMLLDTDTSIRWLNRLTWWHETFRLHLQHDVEIQAAMAASHQRELDQQAASFGREIDGLRTDLRDAVTRYETELAARRNPPFFETWGFAFGMGGLAVAVVVGLLAVLFASL